MTVWAVVYGNYEPPEVLALYDNKVAAEAHAADSPVDSLPYEVTPMSVLTSYQPGSGGR